MRGVFTVEDDGAICQHIEEVSDDMVRDMILHGSVVSVFKSMYLGMQYADVDQVTHELTWKNIRIVEE